MLRGPEHVIELANPRYMELVGHRSVLARPVAEALPDSAAHGPRRSHSSIPARTRVRPSRAAAVKDGPTSGPPGGLVLDRREHGGSCASGLAA
jgi:hypothetical protein